MGIPWETALGAVFWSGILFLILSLLNVRTLLLNAIPATLRHAIAAGIGLFIALIGFSNAGFVVSNPATLVSLGNLTDPMVVLFVIGLGLTSALIIKKIPGAIVISILAVSTLFVFGDGAFGVAAKSPESLVAAPDFSLLFRLDLAGSLKLALWPIIFAFVFTDLFDSLSTFVGVAEAANLKDENGNPRNINKSLLTDAVATTLAGVLGTSPGTAYIESAVGIEQGGRTGLTAVVAAILFLPFMFFSPILSLIPSVATAPALVIVGVYMARPVVKIDWQDLEEAIPAFLAMVLIPFSYSITQGIIWGFLSWTLLKIVQGKFKELSITLLIIDALAIVSLIKGAHA